MKPSLIFFIDHKKANKKIDRIPLVARILFKREKVEKQIESYLKSIFVISNVMDADVLFISQMYNVEPELKHNKEQMLKQFPILRDVKPQ